MKVNCTLFCNNCNLKQEIEELSKRYFEILSFSKPWSIHFKSKFSYVFHFTFTATCWNFVYVIPTYFLMLSSHLNVELDFFYYLVRYIWFLTLFISCYTCLTTLCSLLLNLLIDVQYLCSLICLMIMICRQLRICGKFSYRKWYNTIWQM